MIKPLLVGIIFLKSPEFWRSIFIKAKFKEPGTLCTQVGAKVTESFKLLWSLYLVLTYSEIWKNVKYNSLRCFVFFKKMIEIANRSRREKKLDFLYLIQPCHVTSFLKPWNIHIKIMKFKVTVFTIFNSTYCINLKPVKVNVNVSQVK